jgi:hypothetical protein
MYAGQKKNGNYAGYPPGVVICSIPPNITILLYHEKKLKKIKKNSRRKP